MSEHKQSHYIRWPSAIAVLSGLVVSLMLLFVGQSLAPEVRPAWIKPLLTNLGSTIMVAATVGLLFESLTRREMMHLMNETKLSIAKQIRTLQSLEDLGLIDAVLDSNTYSFKNLILTSRELIVVMNDGRSWVGRNIDFLQNRMLLPNHKTTFIFQHPESVMCAEVLPKKFEQSSSFVQEKIRETVRELKSYQRADSHELQILGHFLFNSYSMFLTDEYAVMVPYYISPGRNTVPLLFFERRGQSSQYQKFYNDMQQLIRRSQSLLPPESEEKR
jgi:hypothetical protein